jgi:hypothetical protein
VHWVRFVPPAALDVPLATVDRWWGRCGVGRVLDPVDFAKFAGDRIGGFDAATRGLGRGGSDRAAAGENANPNVDGTEKGAATTRRAAPEALRDAAERIARDEAAGLWAALDARRAWGLRRRLRGALSRASYLRRGAPC